MKTETVAIIGCGPAGVSAGIQLQRYGFKPRILERNRVGGLVRNAWRIENYPGFPGGVSGGRMARLLSEQIKGKIEVTRAEVIKADYRGARFRIETDRGTFQSRILIIASGTEPKRVFGLKISRTLDGRLLYEPSSLPRSRGKRIAIIGAGDAAFDYALGLANRHRVMIFDRGSKPTCLPLLWRLSRAAPGIRYFKAARVVKAAAGDRFISLELSDRRKFQVDYVLAACGREPRLGFLGSGLKRNLRRLAAERRLWLIGDVKNGRYRQVGISVGDGIRCAMEIADRFGGACG